MLFGLNRIISNELCGIFTLIDEDKTIQIFFGSVGESWVRTTEIRAYNS